MWMEIWNVLVEPLRIIIVPMLLVFGIISTILILESKADDKEE